MGESTAKCLPKCLKTESPECNRGTESPERSRRIDNPISPRYQILADEENSAHVLQS